MAKTILEALNELVEKQGGNTEDNKLIVDALNDLVNTSGGGSSGGGSLLETQTVPALSGDYEYDSENRTITVPNWFKYTCPCNSIDEDFTITISATGYERTFTINHSEEPYDTRVLTGPLDTDTDHSISANPNSETGYVELAIGVLADNGTYHVEITSFDVSYPTEEYAKAWKLSQFF